MLSTPVDCCPHDHIGSNWSHGSFSTLLCQIWLSATNQASETVCDGKSTHFHTSERGSLPVKAHLLYHFLSLKKAKDLHLYFRSWTISANELNLTNAPLSCLFFCFHSEVTTVMYWLTAKPAAIHFLWHHTQTISCNKQLRTVTYTLNVCLLR